MTTMHLIRLAMLLGVLLFGGAVFILGRGQPAPDTPPGTIEQLAWTGRVLWALAVAGILVLWSRTRSENAPRYEVLCIVAWALGDMVALFGGAYWMLTGSPAWYFPGVVLLVAALLAFPARSTVGPVR